MRIDQYTLLYGVVGYPLDHTLSPVMHNTAMRAMDLNAVYLAFETRDLKGCMEAVRALGIRGLSVTLPFKSAVKSLLDEVDPLAGRIDAINTVVNHRGRLIGYNTDATGALKALEETTGLSGKKCLLVGAGGASRAIAFILKQRGLHLTIVNRSMARGEELARAVGCLFLPIKEIRSVQPDILIHTTPVGMYPAENQCIVPLEMLKEGMVVMDIVYNPFETMLLLEARSAGCKTINGLNMFVYQGAEQFRLWTGLNPPITAMADAVKEALTKPQDNIKTSD